MTWLLCDYGEVLCLPPPAGTASRLAELCHLSIAQLEVRYWDQRPAYDRGDLDAAAYWATVVDHPPIVDRPDDHPLVDHPPIVDRPDDHPLVDHPLVDQSPDVDRPDDHPLVDHSPIVDRPDASPPVEHSPIVDRPDGSPPDGRRPELADRHPPGAHPPGPSTVDPDLLARLIDVDTAGWLHPNPASLRAVAAAAERGWAPAILSNAPHEVARAIDARPWLDPFGPRLFSCDLRAIKPDPACYLAALDALGAAPGEVWFFDDRPANVDAARRLGIHAQVFTDPRQIDALPPP